VGCRTGTVLHGENEVFHSNRNDFPKVRIGIWGHYCAIKWLRRLFSKKIIFFTARSNTPLKFVTGVFGRWHDRARFLTFTDVGHITLACMLTGYVNLNQDLMKCTSDIQDFYLKN
jgi:hypothetical protein